MTIDFTHDELRQLERLIFAAEGRFPDAFYSASDKITAALKVRPAPVSSGEPTNG